MARTKHQPSSEAPRRSEEVTTVRVEALLSRVENATEELRATLAEAHGVLRDIRTENKKAERIGPAIVSKQLKKYVTKAATELDEATGEAAKKIIERFHSLEERLLGTNEPGQRNIAELMDKLGPLFPYLHAVITGEMLVKKTKTGSIMIVQKSMVEDLANLELFGVEDAHVLQELSNKLNESK